MTFFRSIFLSKWLGVLLGAIIIQQTLVALGTYFLGKFTNEFPTEGFQLDSALGLFICIFLPGTLVHYAVNIYLTRSIKFSQHSYLNEYSSNNFNQPTHFRSQNSKEKTHDIMFRSGQDAISHTLFFFSDVTATTLNVTLNTISVALVTDLWFGIVILMAGLSGTLIIYILRENISRSSREEMLADAQLNDHLSKSWDSIVLGNTLFYDRWNALFQKLFLQSKTASIEAIRKKNIPIALAGMVTNGIVLGSALVIVWLNQNNLGVAMAVLVMLPRSLQIVMHIQICQKYLAQWKNLKEKLRITQESLVKQAPINLSPYILINKIQANGQPIEMADLIHSIKKLNSGRITLSGENGTGKSNLMLTLKENLGSSAIYLPAHHQFILKESRLKLSSGETTLHALKDIQNEKHKVLLLDEWDANLSAKNRSLMTKMLNELSQSKVVVEVVHQK